MNFPHDLDPICASILLSFSSSVAFPASEACFFFVNLALLQRLSHEKISVRLVAKIGTETIAWPVLALDA